MYRFLQEDDQLLVTSFTRRWVVNGPGVHFVPIWFRAERRKGLVLGPTDYVLLRNTLTGEIRTEKGPKLYFLTAEEEVVEERKAITLKKGEYVRIVDDRTGEIRVEQGEASLYLGPTETLAADVREGVNIDDETAVLVRSRSTGERTLITDPQVFIPNEDQIIMKVRDRIRLEDHDTIVIRDEAGRYIFRTGQDDDRTFFLQPYEEVVQFRWSSGLYKDQRKLQITKLDSRPKFMWYEFEARTQDNVELIIGITFFWQIVDVEKMIRTTDDTPGDVCSHARSMIIQSVSKVTLEHFLSDFNGIVGRTVLDESDPFYDDRGVQLHAVEVRSVACKDPGTQQILQEIIQETTDRINRLQKQESENEVELRRIAGEIEVEEKRERLLELQREHTLSEALTQGEAEAERVRSFFTSIADALTTDEQVAIYNVLRKNDALRTLSEGRAHLYFTPSDVNLSIESD